MPAAAAAVSERAGREQGAAGRAGSGAASAARGAGPQHAADRAARSGRSRVGFGVQVGSGSGIRASARRRRPNFPCWTFPSRPRRRPSPGFQTRRTAKIARGRISTSQRADQAGQLGSSPRPTAEGPGSGRARSLGLSPGSSELYPPPHLCSLSRPPPVGGVSKLKLQLRGWNFLGSSLPQLWSLGMGVLSALKAVAVELGMETDPSPPSVNTETAGHGSYSQRHPPTLCSVAKRSRPGQSLRPLQGALKQAFSWLGRWRDPRY